MLIELALQFLGIVAVTKLQLSLTSLIAVIPATFLIYLLVMALLMYSESLSTIAYAVMGGTLLSTVATVLIPAFVWFGDRRKPAAAPSKPSVKKEAVGDIEVESDDIEVSEASSGSFDAQDVLDESAEFDIGDSDQDMLSGDSERDFDTEPVEDFEDFDIDEDESPKPKKKKR